MVWQTIQSGVNKGVGMNSWPSPLNWVTNVEVLVCNQDLWMARIDLAYNVAADFFWSSFVPSPREVERKYFTGGYRCGFFLNVKVRSPLEIIFGKGTSTVIAQIFEPFARGLFFWWVQQTALSALAAWTTVIFPELYCEEGIGDGLRRADKGALGQGFNSGTPGLGVLSFDKRGWLSTTSAIVFLPPGYWRVRCAWFIHPSPWPTTGLQMGLGLDGHAYRLSNAEDSTPGLPTTHITEDQGHLPDGGALAAWVQGTRPPEALPQGVDLVMFTYSWSPFPFPGPQDGLDAPNPPFPPRLPAKCEESFS